MRNRRLVLVVPLTALGVLALGTLIVVAVGPPVNTTFNVTAHTERVRFVAEEASPSNWVLHNVRIVEDHADSSYRFSGFLEPAPGIEVLIERVARGPLYIRVDRWRTNQPSTASNAHSVGMLRSEADTPLRPAGGVLEIWVDDLDARADWGETFILPLTGVVEAGRELGRESRGTTAILRSGVVTMLSPSILRTRVFEAGSIALNAGDQFRVRNQIEPSQGFILADERPALTAAYRTIGSRGVVIRPGGGTFSVYVSWLEKTVRDPLFVALSVLVGVLAGIAKLYLFLSERRAGRRRPPAPRSLRPRTPVGIAIVCVLMAPSGAAAQESVYVGGAQQGQGILSGRGGACFVVLPRHVIEGGFGEIEVLGPGRLRGFGSIELEYAIDLAILRLESDELTCTAWRTASVGPALRNARTGFLRTVESTGTVSQMPVDILSVTPDDISIRPSRERDEIRQTMSGSALVVNDRVVGLLLDVCGDDCADPREASVLTMDAIVRHTFSFFQPPGADPFEAQMQEQAVALREYYEQTQRANIAALEGMTGRTAGRELPMLRRHFVSLDLVAADGFRCEHPLEPCSPAGGVGDTRLPVRMLYAVLDISEPTVELAPSLPPTLARCKLMSAAGGAHDFVIEARHDERLHWAVAWGDTRRTLSPGEYWLDCAVTGIEFESTRVTLSQPVRPLGEFDAAPGRVATVRAAAVGFEGADPFRWDPGPSATRPEVTLALPRRPDAPLTIALDVEQQGGSPDAALPSMACVVTPMMNAGMQRERPMTVEAQRPGRWRAHTTITTTGRWGPGGLWARCTAGGIPIVEFHLLLEHLS